jgi:hypothetical protein
MKITIELETDEVIDLKNVVQELVEQYLIDLHEAYGPVENSQPTGDYRGMYP